MKLASYLVNGTPSFGAVKREGVVDLPARLGGRYPTLRALLAAGAISEAEAAQSGVAADHALEDVTLLPVITDPDKILCAGVNYRSHAAETGRDVTARPSMFLRMTNTLLGAGQPMLRPVVSGNFDFEGELAVIIGKAGRNIAEANALEYVAGYTCFNDGSLRDYQKFSVTAGKNFPATGPLGPWMVTTDEIPDPSALTLITRLNGEQMQQSGTDLLIYSVQQIIAFCSEFTELLPGDVIATGTPEGVGHRRSPQLWMKPGDLIEVQISRIGVLHNTIAAA
jgi:2-keto-4-pentenoate hydratase/2-oxohepta-3-ene-1,7-dioic acid hydratase in catechol pathway